MKINGVGEAKAMSIVAALELGQRQDGIQHLRSGHGHRPAHVRL